MKQNIYINTQAVITFIMITCTYAYCAVNCPPGYPTASCGTQPSDAVRTALNNILPNLEDCKWSILEPETGGSAAGGYNCIAWSVDETTWFNMRDIDRDYGDNDYVFEISDMDAFYLAKKNWTPVASGAADAEVMFYFPGTGQYHAAKARNCGCLGPVIMFESKLGESYLIEHIWDQVNSPSYGSPVRFYK